MKSNGKSITRKIIERHLVTGSFAAGNEIGFRIDQTLTQDATGTMTYLHFEAMGVPRIRTELSVSYIDHNTIQIGFENADDHRYLLSIARKYGLYFSRAGNGICHQVHLERFGRPGRTLLGSDSHTATGGGLGMIAIGAGGLDVARAMAGMPFFLNSPKVVRINLHERLSPWVSAKDIILKVLEIFTTKGNVNCIFEYGGDGAGSLSVPERATITNMGAECGVTTSIFPSDEMTRVFLDAQGRGEDWIEILADPDAEYDRVVDIDLARLVPLAAKPHSPDNVVPVRDLTGIKIDQVCIGSCTNASYKDLATVAEIIKGRIVHPEVSLIISPGSKQVLENLARDGYLAVLIASGGRLMENSCGFCIGNSQSPGSKAVSLRTSNRNFLGRSGTIDAEVYLVSPETAAVSALTGVITDPQDSGREIRGPGNGGLKYPRIKLPTRFHIDDRLMIRPEDTSDAEAMVVVRGPNIGAPPASTPLPDHLSGIVAIKVGDKVTTDHIIPAGERMKYRSNIPKYSEYVFELLDPDFPGRAKKNRDEGLHNVIIAGHSYGQGSSREHAAICPMYLGVKAVIAKSFERIHVANLVNFGIAPLVFQDPMDYDLCSPEDRLEIHDLRSTLLSGAVITVKNNTRNRTFDITCSLTDRQKRILLAGGMLNSK